MRNNSFHINIFNKLILFSLFILVLNEECNNIDLSNINDDNEKIQKCFSFSCCYNETSKNCSEQNNNQKFCPKQIIINNNCGMAGLYQPINETICTEISLVQGYCCYVKFTDNSTSCLRTKELNKKNKNNPTVQMKNYLKLFKEKGNSSLAADFDIKEVICKGNFLKYNLMYFIILIITLF